MAKRKKGYGNPILDSCSNSLKKLESINDKKSEQLQIAHAAKIKADILTGQARFHNLQICKEMADTILSMDLQLEDNELSFLSMNISIKGEKKMRLLEEIIRRSRHQFYPPIDQYKLLTLSKVYSVIGHDVDLKIFAKNLNKKFEGVAKLRVRKMQYNEHYLETLKRIPQQKVAVDIEFIIQTS